MNSQDQLTIDEAALSAAEKSESTFRIIGSDLLFRPIESFDDKGKWFKAVSVVPKGEQEVTIFTNGKYGISPFLDLPYFVSLASDEKTFTVFNRTGIFDLRNPWKPKALNLPLEDELHNDYFKVLRRLETGFGILTYRRIDSLTSDNPFIVPIFIPRFNIVANLFICSSMNRRNSSGGLTLQGLMNVGDSLRFKKALPSKGLEEGSFTLSPTTGVRNGHITEEGLWETVKPTLIEIERN